MATNKHNLSFIKDVQKPDSVSFRVISPDEIRKGSVCKVHKTDTLVNNKPVKGGIFDLSMGPSSYGQKCESCFQNMEGCPGHFGHIELASPVFHPSFLETLRKLFAHVICMNCSRVFYTKDTIPDAKREAYEAIQKMQKGSLKWSAMDKLLIRIKSSLKKREVCPHCTAQLFEKVKKEAIHRLFGTKREDDPENPTQEKLVSVEITPKTALRVLKNVPEEDLESIGFSRTNHPAWYILSVIPVSPPTNRPNVSDDGSSSQRMNGISNKYLDILKTSATLTNKISQGEQANQEGINSYSQLLQFHISSLFDNSSAGIPKSLHNDKRVFKGFLDSLSKKKGTVRDNMMGKRQEQCARTVITGDPNIPLDGLGVPIKIAMGVSYQETVSPYNVDYLRGLVRIGPKAHPGARSVYKKHNNKLYVLEHVDRDLFADSLEVGDVVERHLQDGDRVVFNRQPTLWKNGWMGHVVKVMPFSTFRMNVTATTPYNADFDGDEMNIHVPQSAITSVETQELMGISNHIIGCTNGEALISPVQDTLVGGYKLTKPETKLDLRMARNLLMYNKRVVAELPEPENSDGTYSGQQIFNMLLPVDFTCEAKLKAVDGKIGSLPMTKDTLKGGSNSIVPRLFHDYGPAYARDFLDSLQHTVVAWLTETGGASVGISDMVTTPAFKEELAKTYRELEESIDEIYRKSRKGEIVNNSIHSNEDHIDFIIDTEIISKAVTNTMKLVKDAANEIPDNRLLDMVTSGSKGSLVNLMQIMGSLGQQTIDGKRLKYGFTNRTNPSSKQFGDSAKDRGFVTNGFLHGLTASQVFHHAKGGRKGLTDTAIRTADTGYIFRRNEKAMNDSRIVSFPVKNSRLQIIQFIYGQDGMDGSKVERQHVRFVSMSVKDIKKQMGYIGKELMEIAMNSRQLMRKHANGDVKNLGSVLYPVNIIQLRTMAMREYPDGQELDEDYAIVRIKKLLMAMDREIKGQAMSIISGLVIDYMTPRRLEKDIGELNKEMFDELVTLVIKRFRSCLVQNGEQVGIVAAQSFSSNITQMALNTFHLSGYKDAGADMVGSLPRLKELLSASKNLKVPQMTIYLEGDTGVVPSGSEKPAEAVHDLVKKLTLVRFKDLVEKTEMYWDPITENGTAVPEDKEFMQLRSELKNGENNDLTPWVMRISLKKDAIFKAGVDVADIHASVATNFGNMNISFSDDNSEEIIARFRIEEGASLPKGSNYVSILRGAEQDALNNVVIKGIEGIERTAWVNKRIYNEVKDEDETQSAIVTLGINLKEVLQMEGIDSKNTWCNDVHTTLDIFGIEATRKLLYNEISTVTSGTSVNPRHLLLLTDVMTNKGRVMTIDRHGINRGQTYSVLTKASFEETSNVLVNAAQWGEKDRLNSSCSRIMLGRLVGAGTGTVDMFMDEDMLREALPTRMPETLADFRDPNSRKCYGASVNMPSIPEQTNVIEMRA